ncbi:GSCFA domain-containing protein [Methylomagnum sp.]
MPVTREEVIKSYRIYLDREPESEEVIALHMQMPSQHHSRDIFLKSKELSLKKSSLNIYLAGNCQANGFAKIINEMSGMKAMALETTPDNQQKVLTGEKYIAADITAASLVIFQTPLSQQFKAFLIDTFNLKSENIRYLPAICFSAFHPDMDYLQLKKGGFVTGYTGPYNSLLAFFAYTKGLTIDQTIKLFNPKIFQLLGYYDLLPASRFSVVDQSMSTGLPLGRLLNKWLSRKESFMHTINHPKLYVLADVMREFFKKESWDYIGGIENYIVDDLGLNFCWEPYPDVALRHGFESSYGFKKHSILSPGGPPIIGLKEFLQVSYDTFSRYDISEVTSLRLSAKPFVDLGELISNNKESVFFDNKGLQNKNNPQVAESRISQSGENPYKNLPSYQFWRRAIERPAKSEVDPVVRARFGLHRTDKIATAGSCFAQHISKTLSKNGFNYYVVEDGRGLEGNELSERNYGVFSARYGNLYTARQLLQLIERAYGLFIPSEEAWLRPDGLYADPFRPQIEPAGFQTIDQLKKSRSTHLAAVKTMFKTLDVLVFTLGLTESWRSKLDGSVFPLAPGVVAGHMDASVYEFINFNVNEIVSDMQIFLDLLHTVNPKARIILTVSPVPLIATYEDRHVLVSSTYSKSALRAAADELVKSNRNVDYFPSYEIITGNYARSEYFEDDLRSVKEEGVNHVMRLFLKYYGGEDDNPVLSAKNDLEDAFENDIERAIKVMSEIVCDEEAIDR